MGNFRSRCAFNQPGFAFARDEACPCPDASALGSFQRGNNRLELCDLGWGVFGLLNGVARVCADTKHEALAKLIVYSRVELG
jgi:hypothetical protein